GEMIWTTPGRHQVAVQREGFSPAIEDIAVLPGKASAVTIELRPIDLRAPTARGGGAGVGSAPPAEESKPVYRNVWFWVAAGVVVAAGVAAGGLLAARHSGGGGGPPAPAP